MNNNSSKQVLLSVIGVAILVVAVVGVSFAFFSFTETGNTTNEVRTGTIVFTASTESLSLTNVFPTSEAYTSHNTDVVNATVTINGKTTYEEGIDFVIRAVNVVNADATNKIIPTIKVTASDVAGKVTYTDVFNGNTITTDTVICRGHIAPNQDVALDNAVTITAYYDRTKYHITKNTLKELQDAGIAPSYVTESTMLVHPDTWNALSGTEEAPTVAYSFKIQINATQGYADGETGRLQQQ